MAVLPPLPHPHPSKKKAKQINAFKFTIILVIQSVYFKTHRQALENHSKPCTQQAHSFPVPLADPPTHPQGQNVQQSLTQELGPRGHSGPGVDQDAGVGVPSLFLPPSFILKLLPLFHPPSHHMALTLPGTQMSPEGQQCSFSRCLLRVFPIYRPLGFH